MKSGRVALFLSVCAAALALSGCGGGERPGLAPPPPPAASTPAPLPPPPPPPPSPPAAAPGTTVYDDTEYRRSNAATSSGAIHAWGAGGTGNGVTVAVVDSGINPSLKEFEGRIHPASQDVASNRGVADSEGHGTAVSAVVGAARNGSGVAGVAFGSTVLSLNTANPKNCTADDGCKHSDSAIAQAIDIAMQNGARVINISLGGDGVGSDVLSAVRRATQAGIVMVISAGNEGKDNPSSFGLNIANMAGNGHVIISGSVGVPVNGDPNQGTDLTQLSSFSNKAGTGSAHYLTALGYRVRTFNQEGVGYLYSGTSFSAPVISGAAALLASAWPHLSGAQIVQLLLTTGDDLGAPGRDPVHGNGRLNIARAFEPQGKISAAGTSVAVPLTGPSGATSGAMGNAIRGQSLGAVVLDGYSRAYAVDLAARLSEAPQDRPLASALGGRGLRTASAAAGPVSVTLTVRHNLSSQLHVGLAQTGMSHDDARSAHALAATAIGRLTPDTVVALGFSESGRTLQQRLSGQYGNAFMIARDPLARVGFNADSDGAFAVRHDAGPFALTVTSERGDIHEAGPHIHPRKPAYSIGSVTADRRIGPVAFSMGASRLAEDSTVLGGRLGFGAGGATSHFLDGSASLHLGSAWQVAASYRHGWTDLGGAAGLVSGGRLSSDAFSFDLSRHSLFVAGDRTAFRIMQPLRVRSGGYDLNLPVSFDYGTMTASFEARRFNLAPTGRELDFEAAYGVGLLRGAGHVSANAYLRLQPGHVADAPNDIGTAIRLTLGF